MKKQNPKKKSTSQKLSTSMAVAKSKSSALSSSTALETKGVLPPLAFNFIKRKTCNYSDEQLKSAKVPRPSSESIASPSISTKKKTKMMFKDFINKDGSQDYFALGIHGDIGYFTDAFGTEESAAEVLLYADDIWNLVKRNQTHFVDMTEFRHPILSSKAFNLGHYDWNSKGPQLSIKLLSDLINSHHAGFTTNHSVVYGLADNNAVTVFQDKVQTNVLEPASSVYFMALGSDQIHLEIINPDSSGANKRLHISLRPGSLLRVGLKAATTWLQVLARKVSTDESMAKESPTAPPVLAIFRFVVQYVETVSGNIILPIKSSRKRLATSHMGKRILATAVCANTDTVVGHENMKTSESGAPKEAPRNSKTKQKKTKNGPATSRKTVKKQEKLDSLKSTQVISISTEIKEKENKEQARAMTRRRSQRVGL